MEKRELCMKGYAIKGIVQHIRISEVNTSIQSTKVFVMYEINGFVRLFV